VNDQGEEVPHGIQGNLVIRKPWPSMLQGIWNDPERYRQTYFPENLGGKLYLAGDGAIRDPKNGYFTIQGRIDDVLNVSGHRLGTAEIEAALGSFPHITESAVVGQKDPITGEAVFAYVVIDHDAKGIDPNEMILDIKAWVSKEISPIAKPATVIIVDGLPKTRSGKIMRRLLRAIANGETITQDTSTLDAPEVLRSIEDKVRNVVKA